jgi:hypothetical protein
VYEKAIKPRTFCNASTGPYSMQAVLHKCTNIKRNKHANGLTITTRKACSLEASIHAHHKLITRFLKKSTADKHVLNVPCINHSTEIINGCIKALTAVEKNG